MGRYGSFVRDLQGSVAPGSERDEVQMSFQFQEVDLSACSCPMGMDVPIARPVFRGDPWPECFVDSGRPLTAKFLIMALLGACLNSPLVLTP
jgi:hypothetical protein